MGTTKIQTDERKKTFQKFLVDEKYLTAKHLSSVILEEEKTGEGLEAAILRLKLMDEERLIHAQSAYFRLPYVDLRNVTFSKEALQVMPVETLENYKLIPFAKEGESLRVAITNPHDLQALEALEFFAQQNQLRLELYLTSRRSFEDALRKTRNITSEVSEALEVMQQTEKEKKALQAKPAVVKKLETDMGEEAPISKIVDVVVRHAIESRASDIHIEPQEKELRIRFRIDGVLQSSLVVPKTAHPAIVSRIKILSNLKIDEQRLPQDGRFHMDIDKKSVDFRVSTLPNVNGEKVVMRILDKSEGVPTLEELGLTGFKLERFKENLRKSHGMLLVTGPTGSGKSTTLYGVLDILNKVGVNIVTLEDPVEYFIPGVNQSQINPEIGLTFASGLRSILRQDPNIIMVGEIRDRETAELAVHSSLTGHLVFSTLHTNDAVGAIPRLVDMGVETFLLTASVNLVMAQRLVRKICESCKQEIPAPYEVREMLQAELADLPSEEKIDFDLKTSKIFAGEGCRICASSGYLGRVGIFEVMPLSDKIKKLILNHASTVDLTAQARAEGMIGMKQDGLIKVLKGMTTIEEVMRVTKE